MPSEDDPPGVIDNTTKHRLEVVVDGVLAQLVYRHNGKRLVLVHTEVPEALAGRGIGGRLVEAAMEAAVSDGLTVVPACPFAALWLRKHPEAADRVEIDWPKD